MSYSMKHLNICVWVWNTQLTRYMVVGLKYATHTLYVCGFEIRNSHVICFLVWNTQLTRYMVVGLKYAKCTEMIADTRRVISSEMLNMFNTSLWMSAMLRLADESTSLNDRHWLCVCCFRVVNINIFLCISNVITTKT